MAKQLAFYFDSSACIGCKACQVACQDKNNLSADIMWRRVFRYGGGNWVQTSSSVVVPNNLFRYFVSISCQHCQNPACVDVCPTTAMHKDENGVVSVDSEKCIGCRYCEWACPYGAPHFDEAVGIMTKCNFCQDLLAEGGAPACVEACVMRALDFGELEELKAKYGSLDAIEPLPSGEYTQPALVITPHRHAELAGEGTGEIMNLAEEI